MEFDDSGERLLVRWIRGRERGWRRERDDHKAPSLRGDGVLYLQRTSAEKCSLKSCLGDSLPPQDPTDNGETDAAHTSFKVTRNN